MAGSAVRWFRSRCAPLAYPAYRRYWTGRVLSAAGSATSPVAVAFAVLHRGGSAAELSWVLIANVAAQILFLLVGGVFADRMRRGRILVVANLLAGGTQGCAGLLVLTGQVQVWQLVMASFVSGTAEAFIGPAAQGTAANLLPAPLVREGTALMRLSFNLCKTAGPALGGVTVALVGAGWAIVWDAGTFLAAAVILSSLPAAAARVRKGRFAVQLWEGLREFAARPRLWVLVVQISCAVLGWLVGFPLLGPIYAGQRLGGPVAWGDIAAGYAAGLLAGSLITLAWRPRRVGMVVSLSLASMAVPLVAMATGAELPVVVASAVLTGAGLDIGIQTYMAYLQSCVPDRLLARMTSLSALGQLLPVPFGYLVAGRFTDAVGIGPMLAGCIGVILLSAVGPPLFLRETRRLRIAGERER